MSETNKHIVDPEQLDHLLSQAFLDLDFTNPKNDIIMDTVSKQVMHTDVYLSPIKQSQSFVSRLFKGYQVLIVLSALIIASLVIYFTLPGKTKSPAPVKVAEHQEQAAISALPRETLVPVNEIKQVIRHKGMIPDPEKKFVPVASDADTVTERLIPLTDLRTEPVAITPAKKAEDTSFIFPVLSEKEIRETIKQKKKMIEQVTRLKKEKYALVPMGSFKYNEQLISLQSFYMQTAEVTNLEYRTFLYDLLIQNRKEEFMQAKPDQSQWVKAMTNRPYFKPFEENYFTHPAYNDYPMVNVSRKGVEMYCIWLTQIANEYLKGKDKPLMNDVRIPTDFEWTYAAQAGTQGEYPWGSSITRSRNGKGCYYMNFNIRKEKIDSAEFSDCNKTPFFRALTSGGLMLGEGTMTVNVYAYNPNDFYLYCMSGNVAEMVNVAKPQTPHNFKHGTKGGSWNSDAEHVKVTNTDDEYKDKEWGSPFVGFRPVFTAPKK